MKPAEISKFSDSDLEAVHGLVQRTISKCYTGIYPERAVKYFRDMYTYEAIADKSIAGTTLVAKIGGEIVGTGSFLGNEISGVFVSIESQGKGVGRQMMEILEKQIFEAGSRFITLSVSLPSFDFYGSFGYGDFKETAIDVGGGQQLSYWKASKHLHEP